MNSTKMHNSMKWQYCLQCQAALQPQQQDPTMKIAIFLEYLVLNNTPFPFTF